MYQKLTLVLIAQNAGRVWTGAPSNFTPTVSPTVLPSVSPTEIPTSSSVASDSFSWIEETSSTKQNWISIAISSDGKNVAAVADTTGKNILNSIN